MLLMRRASSWMLIYAAFLHAIWGCLLLTMPHDIGATPLALLHTIVGVTWTEGCIYLLASAGTLWMLSGRLPAQWSIFVGLPQQLLLMVSAGGSLLAVLLGQYADGVPRPWAFIFADQLPAVLAALCHSGSLIAFHGGWWWQTTRP